MNAYVITIGDEILIGQVMNTNAAYIGEKLSSIGITVDYMAVVGDDEEKILAELKRAAELVNIVLVTGGLGPTHDDVTMEGVAAALGCSLETHDGALAWLEEDGYSRADLTAGTADLPVGARPLHNETGVAPGAVIESVYVLPGVPAEMRTMFDAVADEFSGTQTYREVVVADEPESALLDRITAVRERFEVSVGSYPGDSVRLSLEGTDEETVLTAAAWLRDHVERAE